MIVFDQENRVAVTVGKEIAEAIAKDARQFARLPAASKQHSILAFAKADLVGLVSRMQPFLGNVGTTR